MAVQVYLAAGHIQQVVDHAGFYTLLEMSERSVVSTSQIDSSERYVVGLGRPPAAIYRSNPCLPSASQSHYSEGPCACPDIHLVVVLLVLKTH